MPRPFRRLATPISCQTSFWLEHRGETEARTVHHAWAAPNSFPCRRELRDRNRRPPNHLVPVPAWNVRGKILDKVIPSMPRSARVCFCPHRIAWDRRFGAGVRGRRVGKLALPTTPRAMAGKGETQLIACEPD